MTTIATDRLEELADLERDAWADYREALRDLAGNEYEEAEAAAWEELQRQLVDLEAERSEVASAAGAGA